MAESDEDGFVGYIPQTVNPGYGLLIATICFCVISNLMLPFLAALGRRYEKHRIKTQQQECKDQEGEETQDHDQIDVNQWIQNEETNQKENGRKGQDIDAVSVAPSSYVHGASKSTAASGVKSKFPGIVDKLLMPPYPDDLDGSVLSGYPFRIGMPDVRRGNAPSMVSGVSHTPSEARTDFTIRSTTSTSVLDSALGKRSRIRHPRRQRRALMDRELRKKNQERELHADAREMGFVYVNENGEEVMGMTPSELACMIPPNTKTSSQLAGGSRQQTGHSQVAPSDLHRPAQSELSLRNTGSSAVGHSRRLPQSSNISGMTGLAFSVMSGLDDHAITPGDAADADDPGKQDSILSGPKPMAEEIEVDLCCGENAWWHPRTMARGIDHIISLAEWDQEMKRLASLSTPFAISGLAEGVFGVIQTALIARFLGTDAVAAYSIAGLVLGLSSEFFGGVLSTIATLSSHAVGAGNSKLAGQYVQISVVLYSICLIPNIIFWLFFVDDAVRWFGFNENIVSIAYDYSVVLLFHEWILGMSYGYHGLLSIIDCEKWSTGISIAEDLVDTILVAAITSTRETTLQEIGILHLVVGFAFFIFNTIYTVRKGWVSKYIEGMVGSVAIFNTKAVIQVLKTAGPLSFGYLLQYGEWEVLTVFAARLGPAEVAAWSILGSLWETIETLTQGVADGGEIRCAYHLGAGDPLRARESAYKGILLGVVVAFFFTSFLFILGEDIAVWLTVDPTLQRFIAELLPLIGVGNITLTAGTVAWSLVGSQGRYRLATFVAFCCSWGITIPLAALFTYYYNFDLQGIASAVTIGYSVTGTSLLYILLRSDWDRLAKHIVSINTSESESEDENGGEETGAQQATNESTEIVAA